MPQGIGGLLSWVLIIAVFYIFLIMPERKKQKNMKAMIDSVKAGDKIITRGGIYGTIVSVTDEKIIIVTGPDSVKMELSKMSIGSVIESSKETETEEAAESALDTAESTEAEENTENKSE